MKVCTIEGCGLKMRCKGLCDKHYSVLKNSRKMTPCGCGCGGLTAYNFVWGHHTRLFSNEEQSRRARFNDGSSQRGSGDGKSYRKLHGRHEHRVVAEAALGRSLVPGEVVHHIDGNKFNNSADNLKVMSRADHLREHFPEMLAARKAIHGH